MFSPRIIRIVLERPQTKFMRSHQVSAADLGVNFAVQAVPLGRYRVDPAPGSKSGRTHVNLDFRINDQPRNLLTRILGHLDVERKRMFDLLLHLGHADLERIGF